MSASTQCDIDTSITVAPSAEGFIIATGVPAIDGFIQSGTFVAPPGINLIIDATGKLYIRVVGNAARSDKTYYIGLPPCIYFFKDFGDEPEPDALMRSNIIYDFDPAVIPDNER